MDRETKRFIKHLKKYRGKIPKQQLKTIRGQALSGNLKGARTGLKRLTKEASK